MSNSDIIITSYHEVMRSMLKNEPPLHLSSERGKAEWWEKQWQVEGDPFHRVQQHRIILGEGHIVKNHQSKTPEAVNLLSGKLRWIITGAPIDDGLEEYYAPFRFLRCQNTGSFELFKKNFCNKKSNKALQRLQMILPEVMMARKHGDTLFGNPILQLPPSVRRLWWSSSTMWSGRFTGSLKSVFCPT
jgi:SNF2 family DNA or RNA helicase